MPGTITVWIQFYLLRVPFENSGISYDFFYAYAVHIMHVCVIFFALQSMWDRKAFLGPSQQVLINCSCFDFKPQTQCLIYHFSISFLRRPQTTSLKMQTVCSSNIGIPARDPINKLNKWRSTWNLRRVGLFLNNFLIYDFNICLRTMWVTDWFRSVKILQQSSHFAPWKRQG